MAKTLGTRVTHLESCYKIIGRRLESIEGLLENGLSDKITKAVSDALRKERAAEIKREREERKLEIDEQRVRNERMGRQKDRTNRLFIAFIAPLTVGVMKLAEQVFGG